MRRISLLLFVSFVCAFVNVKGFDCELYVNDFAHVLDKDEKTYINNQGNTLEKATGAQIVVATIESLDGKTVQEYALDLFREWGIGEKEKNNGILVLLAVNDRKARIEVGYGLEGAVNDAKAGRILDEYGISHFKNNRWGNGLCEIYRALALEIYSEYGLDIPGEVSEPIEQTDEDKECEVYFSVFILIFLVMVFIFYTKNRGGGMYIGSGGYFLDGTEFGGVSNGSGFGGGSCGGGGASREF